MLVRCLYASRSVVPIGEELVDTVYLHDLIKVLSDQMGAK